MSKLFNKLALPLALAGLLTGGGALAATALSAQDILARSDRQRNPDQAFSTTVQISEYRGREQINTNTILTYSKPEVSSGRYRNLIRMQLPARDTGKLILSDGNDMWFYDPSSKASIRISPQQRLLGQASNGDVVSVNFSRDYNAVLAAEETISDGEKRERNCYKLMLTATNPAAAYRSIEYWVERDSARPVKGRFFVESGKLLKTAYYRKFEQQLGAERPTETIIIDGLDPTWVTVMKMRDFRYREVPDSWLQRDYLPRFKDD